MNNSFDKKEKYKEAHTNMLKYRKKKSRKMKHTIILIAIPMILSANNKWKHFIYKMHVTPVMVCMARRWVHLQDCKGKKRLYYSEDSKIFREGKHVLQPL